MKDMISQIDYLNKELNKKDEKVHYLEEINRDLKIAYSTVFMQLDEAKKVSKESHVDIQAIEKKI